MNHWILWRFNDHTPFESYSCADIICHHFCSVCGFWGSSGILLKLLDTFRHRYNLQKWYGNAWYRLAPKLASCVESNFDFVDVPDSDRQKNEIPRGKVLIPIDLARIYSSSNSRGEILLWVKCSYVDQNCSYPENHVPDFRTELICLGCFRM